MSCSPYDLRDYLFDELPLPQQGEVRAHLKKCAPCSTDLEALRSTHAALLTVRDEEMPQRIGFVSDKVFEPSPFRRWLAGFWTSAARIGFVSSAMLSVALLLHTLRPAQIVHNSAQPAITQAEIDRRIHDAVATQVSAVIESKVNAAVTQAVAETEERAQKRTTTLLAAAERKLDLERSWTTTVQLEQTRYNRLKNNADMLRANYRDTAESSAQ